MFFNFENKKKTFVKSQGVDTVWVTDEIVK